MRKNVMASVYSVQLKAECFSTCHSFRKNEYFLFLIVIFEEAFSFSFRPQVLTPI